MTATNLQELLDHLDQAARRQDRMTVEALVLLVGERSFGPLILLIGLLLVSPLSGIPGMATSMSILILLIAVQLLIGREHFWLPRWLLQRSASRRQILRTISYLRRPARTIDHWVKPRLGFLARRTGSYVIALACIAIALVMPAMELVPFSATSAGVSLTLFGMALFARDGILALASFVVAGLLFSLLAYHLFF